jgi:hypothetical protein
MSDLEIEELFVDWDPPPLGEDAARWLVSQLSPRDFLRFVQSVREDPDGRAALSGFRLTQDSVRKGSVREALIGRIVPLLVSMKVIRAVFFYVSFPEARWYGWAEVFASHDERWLSARWRELIRGTGDPALAVALSLDDRPGVARRGMRLLRTRALWSQEMQPVPEVLPEAWTRFADLLRMPGAAVDAGRVVREGLEARLMEAETRLKEVEKERARLIKARDDWEGLRANLHERLAKKDASLKKLREQHREQAGRIRTLEAEMDVLVQASAARFRQEFLDGDGADEAVWRDVLEGRTDDLLARADRAVAIQGRLDARCGTLSRVRARIDRLAGKLRDVEQAMSETLVPSTGLLDARRELETELLHWRQMLPEADDAGSPLAQTILAQVRALGVSEEGVAAIEATLADLRRPPLSRLILEEERESLYDRVKALLSERRRILQARLMAGRAPEPPAAHEVRQISNLSGFVVRNYELCAVSIVLVDGYNAIKTSAEWAALDRRDFTGARRRFCDLWELRSQDWAGVELVFDGQGDHAHVEERGRLTVVYTDARAESQRADLYIRERMKALKAESDERKLFLVTADRELRESVIQWCDYFIEPKWALVPYLSWED